MFVVVKTIDYQYSAPENTIEVFDSYKEALSFLENTRRNLRRASDIEFIYNELFESAELCYNTLNATVYYKVIKVTKKNCH